MNVLFVCNQNKHRSKTAEEIFDTINTKSAGIYTNPITDGQLRWADLVVVMEDHQRQEIARKFPAQYLQKRIISLGIPDIYAYQQPELIELLREKTKGLF